MNIFKNRKLRFDILTAFSALICLTVACEIFYSSYANRNLILKFEKEYYSKKISTMASNWLDSYFKQIELVVDVLSKNAVKSIDNENLGFADFEDLFKEGIKKTPFTLSFYVALKNGMYLQVRNTSGLKTFQTDKTKLLPNYATYAVRKIEASKNEELEESWKYLNDDFSLISKEILKKIQYDPRKRDWYVKAELNGEITWSDAYIFATTKLPGITLSSPILQPGENSIYGVVGVDSALTDFQGLLDNVKTSEHSEAYLINNKNEIIASTKGLTDFTSKINDVIVFKKVASCNDQILREASKNLLGTNEYHSTFEIDGKGYVASIQKLNRLPLSILTITPQSDFTANFDKVQNSMLVISIFIFLFSFGVILLLSRRISTPISQLCESARAIGNMELDNYPQPPKSKIFEIQQLSSAMDSMKLSISTFSKYAPKDLVKKLLKSGDTPTLGGRTKKITMLFSDIEKFSTVAEKLPAEYLILHLSEYFDELTKNIMAHNGIIDKYIGDSIMAIWGAPNPDENQVINACEAALDCQKIIEDLKQKWAPLGKPPLPTRIGLHTGMAIVGNIGSQDRMNFTAIGDSVNIASRLEGANKAYGTKILASETVENEARGRILFRVIDRIAVKGRLSGITVFEPLCSIKNANEDTYYKVIELCSKSKEAFELYQSGNFKNALKLYNEIATMFPNKVNSIAPLIDRCREFISTPPIEWDGINHLTSK